LAAAGEGKLNNLGRRETGSAVAGGSPRDNDAFWQNLQSRLQPTVPMDRISVPGRKWNSGFFSTGSTLTAHGLPYTSEYSFPPRLARTEQNPICPSPIRHRREHR